jgi:hypothetical protein
MCSLIDSFPQFKSKPTIFQFAQDGLWESAWSFSHDCMPTHIELVTYLAQRTEVAFEAFFGHSFFGARMTGSTLEVEAFSIKCLQAVDAKESFFSVFQRELGCPVSDQQPSFAEIGCVNAWRSVGAIHISDAQLTPPEFEYLWRLVKESSVGRDIRHAKAIEFAFEHPLAHWFGVPVSPLDESNQVSEYLLRQAIGKV